MERKNRVLRFKVIAMDAIVRVCTAHNKRSLSYFKWEFRHRYRVVVVNLSLLTVWKSQGEYFSIESHLIYFFFASLRLELLLLLWYTSTPNTITCYFFWLNVTVLLTSFLFISILIIVFMCARALFIPFTIAKRYTLGSIPNHSCHTHRAKRERERNTRVAHRISIS